ncbi:MAG: YggS family pyridoxal phosphate-dependent enzyme [Pyrinomonadaceae bacterium]
MTATPETSNDLRRRFAEVQSRIDAAALRSKRVPGEVKLLVVSKSHPADVIKSAIEAGVMDLGENRVQEAEDKIMTVGRRAARWHLIGHLQSNKARRAVTLFDFIHSLDSVELAQRLDRMCVEEERDQLPVLIQMNLAGEASKPGIDQHELPELVETVKRCTHLRLTGLMTVPPFYDDPERVRPVFRLLRELRDELNSQKVFPSGNGELSMGMTNDFPVAIEEGATIVRIGTAIFGERRALNNS